MTPKPEKRNKRYIVFALILGVTLCTGSPFFLLRWWLGETETRIEDRRKKQAEEEFADDRLEDKKPPALDPSLVDRRPFGDSRLNASAAVIRLEMPAIRRDAEAELVGLHPSYAAAVTAAPRDLRLDVLPSVNMLDGKAKQFDDGLYAALDQAYYQGVKGRLLGHVELVRHFYERAGVDNPAAPYLAAALELAGVDVEVADTSTKKKLLREFRSKEVESKPIGFYTWKETLSTCFRFLRFLQRPLDAKEATAVALAQLLARYTDLTADYHKMRVSTLALLIRPRCRQLPR